jgi:MFS family permease
MPRLLNYKDRIFYGWVVAVVYFIIGVVLYGVHLSFGVFFKSIESQFQLSRAATSSILSANMILAGIAAFIAGWALDRYGPRIVVFGMGLFTGLSLVLTGQVNSAWQLYITYSVLLSLGTGAVFVVPMSTISRWFNRKRGLAMGITGSGVGLGTVFIAPFATYLITAFDWRTAYFVIGIIAWVIVIPFSRFLKADPQEIDAFPDGAREVIGSSGSENNRSNYLTVSQAARTRSFWLCVLIWMLFASNAFLVFTHVVPRATDIGYSAMAAATILSVIGGTAAIGRITMGILSDRIGRKATAILCTVLQATATVGFVLVPDLWLFYLFAVLYGLGHGGMAPAMAALVGEIFGVGRIGTMLGLLEVSFGVGAAIGPAVGGYVFDVTGSYLIAFSLGGLVMLLVILLTVFIRREIGRTSVRDAISNS